MDNLKEKMIESAEEVYELTEYTFKFDPKTNIKDCFPADCYRVVTIDGKDYRLHAHFELKKI